MEATKALQLFLVFSNGKKMASSYRSIMAEAGRWYLFPLRRAYQKERGTFLLISSESCRYGGLISRIHQGPSSFSCCISTAQMSISCGASVSALHQSSFSRFSAVCFQFYQPSLPRSQRVLRRLSPFSPFVGPFTQSKCFPRVFPAVQLSQCLRFSPHLDGWTLLRCGQDGERGRRGGSSGTLRCPLCDDPMRWWGMESSLWRKKTGLNLSYCVNVQDLIRALFSECGTVKNIRLLPQKEGSLSRAG